jgi:hypothetical protein
MKSRIELSSSIVVVIIILTTLKKMVVGNHEWLEGSYPMIAPIAATTI